MTDSEKQQTYAAHRAKSRTAATAAYPTVEYRVVLPDGRVITARVIGLSQIAAYYPQAVSVALVREPEPGMMGELW